MRLMVTSQAPAAHVDPDLARLRAAVTGRVLGPADPDYDEHRLLWNRMIDRRPAAIVVVADAEDARQALGFAVERGLPISIRGGGHNVSGSALADGGIVIDHRARRAVTVDPATSTVVVEPGALLGDVDAATAPHDLAVPIGINTTTGLAGLVLGGGIGWLMRRHGLTSDHLIGADVVLADGTLVQAAEDADADLLWALRGGGGNFGIVTRFVFRAVRQDRELIAGLTAFPLEQGEEVLRRYRDWTAGLPRSITAIAALRSLLPVQPVASELHGRQVVVVGFCATDNDDGAAAAAGVAGLGQALFSSVGRKPFVKHQTAFDVTVPPGLDYDWKSHFLTGLPDAAIDRLVELHRQRPTDWSYSILPQLGGAIADIPETATAYANREAPLAVNVNGIAADPADRERIVAWTRLVFDEMAPFSTGGVYVNFMGDEGDARVRAAYGPAYERLAALKARYDPDNVFRTNQNIRPGA